MTFVDFLAWSAALCTFTAFSMKTMLPLRVAAIGANVFFIGYGALGGLLPVLALHVAMLPFNILRLSQILRVVRRARRPHAPRSDLAWLRALMVPAHYPSGTRVFRKGDPPDALYLLDEGRVRLDEIGVELAPGEIFGEIAFFSEARARTLTATCITPCRIRSLDEVSFLTLHYQNPELSLAIVRLVTSRLLNGMAHAPRAYVEQPCSGDV